MLSYKRESISQLRGRYRDALARDFDCRSGKMPAPRPGECRECVFDSMDGLRLIISIDIMDNGPYLHVSASIDESGAIYQEVGGYLTPQESIAAFLALSESRFRAISGDHRELKFYGLSEGKGVPHWFIKLEEK